jgi:DNA-nicking Smr family endonuclease
MSNRGDLRSQLASVQRTLAQQQREMEQQRAQEAARLHRERAERDHFSRAVGPVQPIAAAVRALHGGTPAEPVPRQRLADEAQALASSLSDHLDIATLLETDAGLAFRREGIGPDVLTRLRRGQWTIQRELDLHGLTRDAAREALADFVRRAARDGLRCVRVIHGKGNGSPGRVPVLKDKVRAWLVQKSEVIAFAQARAADGGYGALLVLLRG